MTQSGKIYTWGLANEGRLGTRRVKNLKISGKNSYSYQPQKIQFTNDNIDKIHASGSMAYCEATQIVKEDTKLPGKGTEGNVDIKT